MKRFILILSLIWISVCAYCQLLGQFSLAQDGHLYFYLSNPTNYNFPLTWGVYNHDKEEMRTNNGVLQAGGTFIYGLNYNWIWEKGEAFFVKYPDGQLRTWICPENDPSLPSRNIPFKGSYSSYNGNKCSVKNKIGVYCDCPGCYSSNRNPKFCNRCLHECEQHRGH